MYKSTQNIVEPNFQMFIKDFLIYNLLVEKTMFECHVNLFSYITILTIIANHYKVELFENNVELKQKKYI